MFNLGEKSINIPKSIHTSESGDFLKNYDAIEQSEWMNIELKSFIRYEKIDGKLVSGGYLINKSHEQKVFRLKKDLSDHASPEWTVSLSGVKHIWKRRRSAEGNNDVIAYLKDISRRITILENVPQQEGKDYSSEIAQCQVDIGNLKSDIVKLYTCLQQIVETIEKNKEDETL